jgi:predicted ATPase
LLGHRAVGTVSLFLGSFGLARRHLKRVLALYDPGRHHSLASLYVFDPWVVAVSYLAIAEFALGYPTQAKMQVVKALKGARKLGHPYSLAHALYFACLFRQLSRDHPAVQKRVGALKRLCRKAGFRSYGAGAAVLESWAQVELAEPGEGIEQVCQKLDDYRRAEKRKYLLPYWLALAAEALCKCGQATEALSKLDEAVDITDHTGECWFEPELHRIKGDVLRRAPEVDPADSETCLRKAIAVAQGQGAKLWELRATTSLARLWRHHGRRAEAHDLLAPVYGWFTEGFDTADLKDTKALLDELA